MKQWHNNIIATEIFTEANETTKINSLFIVRIRSNVDHARGL